METTKNKLTLNPAIFDVEVKNHELIKLAYDSYLANARSAHAKTKKRGEVSGGGKKPWRQKGTGRARFGSTRNPIWRGGGIVFGPTGSENYTKNISVRNKRLAIKQALTLAAQADKIVLSSLNLDGKTKTAVALLTKNDIKDTDRVLIVVSEKSQDILRSTNNLGQVKLVRSTYLTVFDILNADKILVQTEAMPQINKWLTGEEK